METPLFTVYMYMYIHPYYGKFGRLFEAPVVFPFPNLDKLGCADVAGFKGAVKLTCAGAVWATLPSGSNHCPKPARNP